MLLSHVEIRDANEMLVPQVSMGIGPPYYQVVIYSGRPVYLSEGVGPR